MERCSIEDCHSQPSFECPCQNPPFHGCDQHLITHISDLTNSHTPQRILLQISDLETQTCQKILKKLEQDHFKSQQKIIRHHQIKIQHLQDKIQRQYQKLAQALKHNSAKVFDQRQALAQIVNRKQLRKASKLTHSLYTAKLKGLSINQEMISEAIQNYQQQSEIRVQQSSQTTDHYFQYSSQQEEKGPSALLASVFQSGINMIFSQNSLQVTDSYCMCIHPQQQELVITNTVQVSQTLKNELFNSKSRALALSYTHILLTGGDTHFTQYQALCIDLTDQSVTILQRMRNSHWSHAMTSFKSFPMVISGYSETGLTNTTQIFTDYQWKLAASVKLARQSHSACSMQKSVYIIGGYDQNDTPIQSIEIYQNGKWKLLNVYFGFPGQIGCFNFNNKSVLIVSNLGTYKFSSVSKRIKKIDQVERKSGLMNSWIYSQGGQFKGVDTQGAFFSIKQKQTENSKECIIQ